MRGASQTQKLYAGQRAGSLLTQVTGHPGTPIQFLFREGAAAPPPEPVLPVGGESQLPKLCD